MVKIIAIGVCAAAFSFVGCGGVVDSTDSNTQYVGQARVIENLDSSLSLSDGNQVVNVAKITVGDEVQALNAPPSGGMCCTGCLIDMGTGQGHCDECHPCSQ